MGAQASHRLKCNQSCHYRLLNLSSQCTKNEVKAAFRQRAKALHPDVLPRHAGQQATHLRGCPEVPAAAGGLQLPHRRDGFLVAGGVRMECCCYVPIPPPPQAEEAQTIRATTAESGSPLSTSKTACEAKPCQQPKSPDCTEAVGGMRRAKAAEPSCEQAVPPPGSGNASQSSPVHNISHAASAGAYNEEAVDQLFEVLQRSGRPRSSAGSSQSEELVYIDSDGIVRPRRTFAPSGQPSAHIFRVVKPS
mmetsp:Transcript_68883/g.165343  ORF Transcript_68883/g.165343 Transcript_68883/m.165343 type:complete len:249 (+) Transcript_68883:56-802(+)